MLLTDEDTESESGMNGEGLREFFHDDATERVKFKEGCSCSCALRTATFLGGYVQVRG